MTTVIKTGIITQRNNVISSTLGPYWKSDNGKQRMVYLNSFVFLCNVPEQFTGTIKLHLNLLVQILMQQSLFE